MSLGGRRNPYADDEFFGAGDPDCPSEPKEPPPASFYDEIVARAESGDREARRKLVEDLERLLAGFADIDNAVYQSPTVREFLARQLRYAFGARQADVGELLGLGAGKKGTRRSHLDEHRVAFIDWYVNRTKDLGFTCREVWEERWLEEVKEVAGWVADHIPQGVDDKTVRLWRGTARERLFTHEVFADVPRPPSTDDGGNQ